MRPRLLFPEENKPKLLRFEAKREEFETPITFRIIVKGTLLKHGGEILDDAYFFPKENKSKLLANIAVERNCSF